jgi:heavy metal translocating P-type ATPase
MISGSSRTASVTLAVEAVVLDTEAASDGSGDGDPGGRQVDMGFEAVTPLVGYEVIHRTQRRLRLRIPRLIDDPNYAETLQCLVEALDGVVSVRVNLAAQSLVVETEGAIAPFESQLFEAIQQAHCIDLETAMQGRPPQDDDEQAVNLTERLALPGLGMLLGFGMMVGMPLPGLLVTAIILLGTRPVYDRALGALFKDGELAIDLLDGLAITLHTLEGNFFPPALMLGMVEGGEAIRDITARGSERASLDLLSCLGTEAIVERDGEELKIPIDQVVVGDRVIVYPGDQIPVDGTVLKGSGLVDQCKLTGESIPITRDSGEEVFASTILVDGHLCIVAERLGTDTRAGVIANLMQTAPVYDTRVSNFATKVANQLVAPTLLVSAVVGTLSGDVSRAISILTLDVGTGIRISVPTTVLSALTYAARNGVLIRTGRTIEMLSEVDVIVFDKTGTLTQGHAGVTDIKRLTADLSDTDILTLAATAEQGLTHPVAEAIIRHAKDCQLPLGHCDEWEYHVGLGVEAQIDGQQVFVGSHRLMAQQRISLADLHQRFPDLESGPHSLVYVAVERSLVGVILYSDPIRDESPAVVQALQAQGIDVYILSGDETRVAQAVANELQIPGDRVYAEAFPERKVEVVKALRDQGKTVAFCGDGINDSAALAYADISISFAGASGIARETADVVLMENDLNRLQEAIQISKNAMEIVSQNIAMVIVPNVGAVMAGVFLAINPVLAILINNGSAILAELNGLRPLLGPNGLPQWGSARQSVRSVSAQPTLGQAALGPSVPEPTAPEPTAPKPTASELPPEIKPLVGSAATVTPPLGESQPEPFPPAPMTKPERHLQSVAAGPPVPEALIQKALAERLGVSSQTISRRKRQSTFAEWSRRQDPDRVAWCYDRGERLFHPVLAQTIPFRPAQGGRAHPGAEVRHARSVLAVRG